MSSKAPPLDPDHKKFGAITPNQIQIVQNAHNQTTNNAPILNQSQMIQNINNIMQVQKLPTASTTPHQFQMMRDTREVIMRMQQTPTHDKMTSEHAPMDSWMHTNEAKENSSRAANVTKQLNDAKLRIADAKKFILNRNSRRVMTPQGTATHTGHNHSLKPSTGMTATPFSHMPHQVNPGVQLCMMTPSSYVQHPAGTPEGMRQIGSLISPTEETNNKNTAQKYIAADHTQLSHQSGMIGGQTSVVTSGTQGRILGSLHDGYLTPEMPDRYFFA